MSERTLLVSLNSGPVGTLRDENGIWSFKYDSAWLNDQQHFGLSPSLPLQHAPLLDLSSKRPVQWYFDNLLPEEHQRRLLAGDARIDAADAFGLLGYYGAESAGSLTLLAPDAQNQMEEALLPLSDVELNERILALPRVPLTHGAKKRMSLAGAQHKLAVVLQDGALFEPAGATPSTHIIKPDHPDADYPHSVINEWFVMRLAKRAGLNVPDVHRRYVPAPVYIIDRFDRVRDARGWQRRHVIDACQLLGLDRSFKYSQGSMASLVALADQCRGNIVARTRLFSWLVFNVLVGNTDAHLKNLSFLVSEEGVELAPHYDILSTACYETLAYDKKSWPNLTEMAWPILGKQFIADVDRALLIEAADALNIRKATAERLLDNLCNHIMGKAEEIYQEFEAENAFLKQRADLAPILAGESRCLRTIIHVVIKEVAAKLKQR